MMIHRMRFNYMYLLILLLALAVVKSDDASAQEQAWAKEVGDYVCKDTDRYPAWYSCMSCCQGMFPFYLKNEPNAVVREALYGEASFTEDTKQRLCGGMRSYATALKNELVDNSGPLNASYVTEKGLSDFYYEKIGCFRECQGNEPEKKLRCIPFTVASYSQYDLPMKAQREEERQRRESMKPKTGSYCRLKALARFLTFRGDDDYLGRCETGNT